MTKTVTICPPAKAYGYDRDTLDKHDKMLHDWDRHDDHSRALHGRFQAAIIPSDVLVIEPRDYPGDPT